MPRKYFILFVLIFFPVIFTSYVSAATKKQQEAAVYVANFNYTPDSPAAPGSAGVTFAVGDVSYRPQGKRLWVAYPEFENLHKVIKDDLSKLLLAKGFSVRGPYESYDLIPYQDKQAIDLWLISTIELTHTFNDKTTSTHSAGDSELNGKIILELREIMTRELMWTKTIPFKKYEFSFSIPIPHLAPNQSYDIGPSLASYISKGVEQQYPEFMATIFKLIDPEEMKIIRKQCQELKSKKGY